MLKPWALAAAISVLAVGPALADPGTCGDEPFAPVIPTAAEIGQKPAVDAQKSKHQAFEDIKAWQAQLKDFRNCLDSDENDTKRKLQDAQTATKPDQDKIGGLKAEIASDDKAYARSTDSEERIVNDFHALSVAYCARADTDKASCPKA